MTSISRFERLLARLKEYKEWVQLAEAQTGKGLLAQAREILALKQYGGQCGISDYYWYKLYDDDYQLGRGAPDFIGWRLQQHFSHALNPRHAVLPAWDKVVFAQLATAFGLPLAPIKACFHRAKRISESLGHHLRTRDEAERFLRDQTNYPLFGKPAYSQQGYGADYLTSFDPAENCLKLINNKSIPIDLFLDRLETPFDHRYHMPPCGFIFQEPLKPAPEIEHLTGWRAVCGVRVICLNTSNGAVPIRAIWKIAVPPNHIDNFSLGKNGNLLADVDLSSGEISRVVGGFWPKTKIMSSHPLTGKSFIGFKLPGWERILDTCQLGGDIFPLMKIHHWDFALTDSGPKILELNDLGGTEIAQVHGHGLLTETTREFLKQHADRKAHPWVNDL